MVAGGGSHRCQRIGEVYVADQQLGYGQVSCVDSGVGADFYCFGARIREGTYLSRIRICVFYSCDYLQVWEYAKLAEIDPDSTPAEGSEHYEDPEPVSFKNSNLQAVVKIADYVFAPGSTFSGVWHYEGMAHENIVMTGLYYPASDERLGGGLEFKRQFTDVEGTRLLFGVAQTRPPWLNEIISEGFVPLGYTTTETGKLMVFPNCHAHRVLEMVNNTQETLRRRLIVFFIVDPERRIPSSKDFPPMPRKISLETALADRLELMQERKQAKQELNPREIELCEH
jgi:hypothetical protein